MSDDRLDTVQSPDLVEVGEFLRRRGFGIGTGEILRATSVLRALRKRPDAPVTLAAAAPWLAPVLTTSEVEQHILPSLLSSYENSVSSAQKTTNSSREVLVDPAPATKSQSRLRFRNTFLFALASLILLAAALFWGFSSNLPAVSIPPVELPVGPVHEMMVPGWILALQRVAPDWNEIAIALPFSMPPLLVWWLLRCWRAQRHSIIDRWPDPGLLEKGLVEPSSALKLFAPEDLTWTLQALRAHRLVTSAALDVPATARATAAAAGRFIPVCGKRPQLPDYPLVVEKLCANDHLAALGDALATSFREGQVAFQLYASRGDFTFVQSEDGSSWRLSDLAARHNADYLLLIGDGEALLGRGGRSISQVMEAAVEQWTGVVLLTPLPRWRWSWRERQLAESGIIVLPATPTGLQVLGDYLRAGYDAERPRLALRQQLAHPGPLARESRTALRWHTNKPPSRGERDAVLDALALEVPDASLELARVLALFPELRPDLTLYVAERLAQSGEASLKLDEEAIGALAATPWFRFGRLPDWLRADLVSELKPERLGQARKIYDAWLQPTDRGDTGWSFQKAVGAASRRAGSPLRDVIFLRFSRGESLEDVVTLEAPEAMARELQPPFFSIERLGLLSAIVTAAGIFSSATVSRLSPEFFYVPIPKQDPYWNWIRLVLWLVPPIGVAGWLWQMKRCVPEHPSPFRPWPTIVAALGMIGPMTIGVKNPNLDFPFLLLFAAACVVCTMLPVSPAPLDPVTPLSFLRGSATRLSSSFVVLALIITRITTAMAFLSANGPIDVPVQIIGLWALDCALSGWVLAREFQMRTWSSAVASLLGGVALLLVPLAFFDVIQVAQIALLYAGMQIGAQIGAAFLFRSKGTLRLPGRLVPFLLIVGGWALMVAGWYKAVPPLPTATIIVFTIYINLLLVYGAEPKRPRSLLFRDMFLLHLPYTPLFVAGLLTVPVIGMLLFASVANVGVVLRATASIAFAIASAIASVLALLLIPEVARLTRFERSGWRAIGRPALRAIGLIILNAGTALVRWLIVLPLLLIGIHPGLGLGFLPIAYMPATALAGIWLGRDSIVLVTIGALPLVVGVNYGSYAWTSNLGLYVLSLAVALLVAAPEWRLCLQGLVLTPFQIFAILLALSWSLSADLISGQPHVWIAFQLSLPLWAAVAGLGALLTPRLPFYAGTATMLLANIGLTRLFGSALHQPALGFTFWSQLYLPTGLLTMILAFETARLSRKLADNANVGTAATVLTALAAITVILTLIRLRTPFQPSEAFVPLMDHGILLVIWSFAGYFITRTGWLLYNNFFVPVAIAAIAIPAVLYIYTTHTGSEPILGQAFFGVWTIAWEHPDYASLLGYALSGLALGSAWARVTVQKKPMGVGERISVIETTESRVFKSA
ncbi:MAG: hypothetical protein JO249_13530 [Acidobacteria bacterium]|nr:hypothetical protein [Acidobacteriota bacterium]